MVSVDQRSHKNAAATEIDVDLKNFSFSNHRIGQFRKETNKRTVPFTANQFRWRDYQCSSESFRTPSQFVWGAEEPEAMVLHPTGRPYFLTQ